MGEDQARLERLGRFLVSPEANAGVRLLELNFVNPEALTRTLRAVFCGPKSTRSSN
jgi:hypothetical protein